LTKIWNETNAIMAEPAAIVKDTVVHPVFICDGHSQGGWRYIQSMTEFGKLLVLLGAVLVVAGLALMLLGRIHLPIGRLPGDFLYRNKGTTVYFPLATSLLLSVVLSLVLYVVSRFRR
jgi:hypothetical protein